MGNVAGEQPSPALRLGRHTVGIMIAALANPMIYFDTQKVLVWLATWGPVLIATAVIYGLLTLFLTRRARAAWPRGAITLAWVLLLLLLVGNWMNYREAKSHTSSTGADAPIDWEKGAMSAPPASQSPPRSFTYEEAVGKARPTADAAQERPQEPGPWVEPPPNLKPFEGKLDSEK